MGVCSLVVKSTKSTIRVCIINKFKILQEVSLLKSENASVPTIKEQLASEFRAQGYHLVSLSVLAES